MTNYHLKPLNTLPSLEAQEKKAARKEQLEEVKARRKIISQHFQKKRQLQASGDLV